MVFSFGEICAKKRENDVQKVQFFVAKRLFEKQQSCRLLRE